MGAVKVRRDSQLEEIKVDEILLTNRDDVENNCSMYSENMTNKSDETNLFNPVEFKQLFMCGDDDTNTNIVDKYCLLFLINCQTTMSLLSNKTLPRSINIIDVNEDTLPHGMNLDREQSIITINLNKYHLIYQDEILYYVKKIHSFPIVIQFSIGFDKSENMEVLKNISKICNELCTPSRSLFCKNMI
jgi:hypothetical protein